MATFAFGIVQDLNIVDEFGLIVEGQAQAFASDAINIADEVSYIVDEEANVITNLIRIPDSFDYQWDNFGSFINDVPDFLNYYFYMTTGIVNRLIYWIDSVYKQSGWTPLTWTMPTGDVIVPTTNFTELVGQHWNSKTFWNNIRTAFEYMATRWGLKTPILANMFNSYMTNVKGVTTAYGQARWEKTLDEMLQDGIIRFSDFSQHIPYYHLDSSPPIFPIPQDHDTSRINWDAIGTITKNYTHTATNINFDDHADRVSAIEDFLSNIASYETESGISFPLLDNNGWGIGLKFTYDWKYFINDAGTPGFILDDFADGYEDIGPQDVTFAAKTIYRYSYLHIPKHNLRNYFGYYEVDGFLLGSTKVLIPSSGLSGVNHVGFDKDYFTPAKCKWVYGIVDVPSGYVHGADNTAIMEPIIHTAVSTSNYQIIKSIDHIADGSGSNTTTTIVDLKSMYEASADNKILWIATIPEDITLTSIGIDIDEEDIYQVETGSNWRDVQTETQLYYQIRNTLEGQTVGQSVPASVVNELTTLGDPPLVYGDLTHSQVMQNVISGYDTSQPRVLLRDPLDPDSDSFHNQKIVIHP